VTHLLDRLLALLLGRMTADAQARRNVFWATLSGILYGMGSALFGGELWTGFLVKTGFSQTQIGILSSVGTFASAFGLLALMGLGDRIERRIRTYSLTVLAIAVVPVVVAGIAMVPRTALGLPAMLGLLIAISLAQTLVAALWVMLSYAITVRTVPVPIRGRVFAIGQTAFSIQGIGLGYASATVLKGVEYPTGYVVCFLAAAVTMVLRALTFARQRELPDLAVPGASRSALPFAAIMDVLRLKEFQWLAPPHILRGLCVSVPAVFSVSVGLKYLTLPEEYPGYATSANYAAGVLGGIALGFISDRWGAGKSTLFGDVLVAVGIGSLLLFRSPPLFLALYLLAHFGRNIEDVAIPFGCTIIVPPERMGAFSAARLMVLNGSNAVGALLFGYLFDRFADNPIPVFAVAAVLKLLNGVWFWYVFRLRKPEDAEAHIREVMQAAHTGSGAGAEGGPGDTK
jgi:MFS family permease